MDLKSPDGKIVFEEYGGLFINQIEWVIDTYKRFGGRNNHMMLPTDITLTPIALPKAHRHPNSRPLTDPLRLFQILGPVGWTLCKSRRYPEPERTHDR